jgi:DNA-binding transcriptional LysR family regulator
MEQGMDFRQLEAFIKVMESGSFSKAAEELHISQPSVSTYINSLEKELGSTLLNRSTKAISTTLAGERFLGQAKKMILLKQETIDMIQNLSNDLSGEIRILASSVPASYILPGLLAEFHKQNPNISFTVNQADTSEVVQGLAAHKADIGFAGSMIGEKKCEFIEFMNESLVFIAPNNGLFSENKSYSLEELLYTTNFISREIGSGTRIQYEKYFIECGISLDRIKNCISMDSTHSILTSVANGLGVSIVSEVAAVQMIKQKALISLMMDKGLPERKIYLVKNKAISHSHLVDLFIKFVISNCFTLLHLALP